MYRFPLPSLSSILENHLMKKSKSTCSTCCKDSVLFSVSFCIPSQAAMTSNAQTISLITYGRMFFSSVNTPCGSLSGDGKWKNRDHHPSLRSAWSCSLINSMALLMSMWMSKVTGYMLPFWRAQNVVLAAQCLTSWRMLFVPLRYLYKFKISIQPKVWRRAAWEDMVWCGGAWTGVWIVILLLRTELRKKYCQRTLHYRSFCLFSHWTVQQ